MMLRLILHTARPSMIIIPKWTSVSYTKHDPHPGITIRGLVRGNCAARASELLLICEDSLKLKRNKILMKTFVYISRKLFCSL